MSDTQKNVPRKTMLQEEKISLNRFSWHCKIGKTVKVASICQVIKNCQVN